METKAAARQKKSTLALQVGGWSILVTAVVLAILIVLNILASALPATLTKLDISSSPHPLSSSSFSSSLVYSLGDHAEK